jgi:hypothetical protein
MVDPWPPLMKIKLTALPLPISANDALSRINRMQPLLPGLVSPSVDIETQARVTAPSTPDPYLSRSQRVLDMPKLDT